jgi:hypothetical protein
MNAEWKPSCFHSAFIVSRSLFVFSTSQVFLKFIYYRLKYFSSRLSKLHAFR